MYDKGKVVVAISKSSLLLEEQKRGILRGYCRDVRPVEYIGPGAQFKDTS